MKNFKKILAIIVATSALSTMASESSINQINSIMANADPYIKKAIDRTLQLYSGNQGATLSAAESQVNSDNKIFSSLNITTSYNITMVMKSIQLKTEEAAALSKDLKIILAPIVGTVTTNKHVGISSFYCATNIGPELLPGQDDKLNIRSPIADATSIKMMNNCMYVGETAIAALIAAA